MADLQPLTLANAGNPGMLPDKTMNPWQVLRGSNLGYEGQGLQDVAQKGAIFANNYNEGVVNSLLPALQSTYLAQRDRAQTLQGQNVLSAGTDENGDPQTYSQSALAAFDATVQQQLGQAKNDQQRRSLQEQATQMRVGLEAFTNAHQNLQLHQASIQGTASAAQGYSDMMVAAMKSGDIGAFSDAYSALEDKVAQLSALKGSDPATAKQDRLNIMSTSYSQVLNAMLTSGRPGAYKDAQDFFQGVKDDMTQQDQARMQRTIQAYTVPQQALDVSKQVWGAATAGWSDTDLKYKAPPIADMVKAINDRGDLDPDAKSAAIAQVHQLWSFQKAQAQETMNQVTGNAWSSLLDKHQSLASIMSSPDVIQMPGDDRAALQAKLEAFVKRNEGQEPMDPVSIAKRGFLFNDLLDRFRQGSLTKADVYAAAPDLGKQYTATLVSTIGDAQASPAKVQQYHVDNDLLTSSLRQAGLIKDAGESEASKILLGDLSAKIMLRQSASQQPWSQENTQKLIDTELQPIITDPSHHFWTSNTTQPAFKAEDQVPQAFIQQVLKKRPGMSRNQITQAYFLAKDQGLLNDDGTPKANP